MSIDSFAIATWDAAGLRNAGFVGFRTVADLRADRCLCVPENPGLYVAVYTSADKPTLLSESPAGHFKGRNPTVPTDTLLARWIPETQIIYLGQTGGHSSEGTLRSRLRAYIDFGGGKPVGHWGGRYTWQLASHADLAIAWLSVAGTDPRAIEEHLLDEFKRTFGRLPYANILG